MLPADVARCSGVEDGDDLRADCKTCLRRTDRSYFPQVNWIGAPDVQPCPMRIPDDGEADVVV